MPEENASKQFALITDLFFKGDSDIPSEIQIVPVGDYNHPEYGEFSITEKDLNKIIKNFNKMENDIPIDYEHQTLTGEEAPAAGWIKKLFKKVNEGIWAVVEWTDKAKEYIKNKEYRYISPVINFNATDKESGKVIGARVHSIALTNTPWFDGMQPIVTKDNLQIVMLNKIKKGDLVMLEKLKKLLGLSDETDESKVIEELEKLVKAKDSIPDLKGIFKELDLKENAKVEDVVSAIKEFKGKLDKKDEELEKEYVPLSQFTELKTDFDKLKATRDKEIADNVVLSAMKEGKITKAQKEWAEKYALTDPAGFELFVKNAPKVVGTERLTDNDVPEDSATKKMNELTKEKMKEFKDQKMNYSEAYKIVAKENLDLAAKCLEESKGK